MINVIAAALDEAQEGLLGTTTVALADMSNAQLIPS